MCRGARLSLTRQTEAREPSVWSSWRRSFASSSRALMLPNHELYDEPHNGLGCSVPPSSSRSARILSRSAMASACVRRQVGRLGSEFNIFMLKSGRISMAGVSSATVGYLAESIAKVL